MVEAESHSNRAVAYIDVLGFAALTALHEVDETALRRADRLFGLTIDDIMRVQQNELTRIFHNFHQAVRAAIETAQMRHPVTAITFSDSTFVAAERLNDIADIVINIVSDLVLRRVPARAGIAYGSFAALRFRSDVTSDGGDHAAHFLGTAVVRAYSAESCGIKGIRVLVHPSAMEVASDPTHTAARRRQHEWRVLPCARHESDGARVTHELDYWRFGLTAESKAWHAVQDMWDTAPSDEQAHYLATANAIDRMRVARGEPPLLDVRRRTLPRTTTKE